MDSRLTTCWPWPGAAPGSSSTPRRWSGSAPPATSSTACWPAASRCTGSTPGSGSLARHHIPLEEIGAFSFATVADQVSSYGRPLATDVVRAMMVSRVNGMLKAGVGVRRELIELLVALLNAGVHPIVRMVGSVGQGDLSEMADIGKVLIGRGWAEYEGETMPGEQALARAGIEPISARAQGGAGADQRQRRDRWAAARWCWSTPPT